MDFSRFRTIVINAVGRGTEASPSTTRSAWSVANAKVLGSAASVGFMQHDFGQRRGSAADFLGEYNQWAQVENARITDPAYRHPLLTEAGLTAAKDAFEAKDNAKTYENYFGSDAGKRLRASLDAFTNSDAGRATISFFDAAQVDYLWKGTSIWPATNTFRGSKDFVATSWFNSLSEDDQTRALVVYAKVTNQNGNANALFTWSQTQTPGAAGSADLFVQFQQKATTSYPTIHIGEAVEAANIHIRFINHPAFADAKAYWDAGGEIMGPGGSDVLQAQINLYHNLTLANKGGSSFTRETGNPAINAAMKQTADGGRSICSWGSTSNADDDYCISSTSKNGQAGWIYRNGEWLKYENGFEIQRTPTGSLKISFNGLPGADLPLDEGGVANLNINGTDVTLDANSGSRYAFDANGDLGSMAQDGNRWVGMVLTGESKGKTYAYIDFNLDPDGSGIRNASFTNVPSIGQSNNYQMEINDGQGGVTITIVKPIRQNIDGAQVVIGSESSVEKSQAGIVQSKTLTSDSTDPVTAAHTLTTDTTLYNSAGAFASRNATSIVTNSVGLQLNQLDVTYNAEGKIIQTSLTERQADNSLLTTVRDGLGNTVSTSNIQTYDDGSTFATTSYPNGATTSLTTNADGTLFSREVTIPKGIGSETSLYNGAGVLQSVTVRQGDDDGNTLVSVTTNAGTTATAYDPDRNVISETFTPAGAVANFDTAAQTAVDLIQFGQLLASNAPGAIKLANGAVLLNKLSTQNGQPLFSAGTGQVIEGALSLYSLSNAWKYGDGLAKTTATLSTLSFVNRTLIGNQALGAALNGNGLVNGAPGILPALGLISAIKANDPIGMAQSAIALINPGLLYSAGAVTPLGWVLIGASILQSLFSDDGPPDAWGVASVTFGEGITNYGSQVNASGENFGPERVRGQLQGTLDALNGIIGQANSGNPDSRQHLGLIPQRMPSLNYRAAEFQDKGYSVTDIDPLTGAQRAPFLRFDDEGKLFGALPGQLSAEERAMLYLDGASNVPALTAYMLNSALQRQAIAPMWEVKTARLQQEAGDPNAGLTELQRARLIGQYISSGGVESSWPINRYKFDSCLRASYKGKVPIWHVSSLSEPANCVFLRNAA